MRPDRSPYHPTERTGDQDAYLHPDNAAALEEDDGEHRVLHGQPKRYWLHGKQNEPPSKRMRLSSKTSENPARQGLEQAPRALAPLVQPGDTEFFQEQAGAWCGIPYG